MIPAFLACISLVLASCAMTYTSNETKTGYNFSKPDQTLLLPDTLREVSGLTIIDSTTFACVQDENGILFIYDIIAGKIKHQYPFHIDGDYEGIAKVGTTMYILRSDGTLFEISNYMSPDFKLSSYNTGIPANNNEGLCLDSLNNRLLIACKGKIGKGMEFKDKRMIYGFDLQGKHLKIDPVFNFDMQAVKQFAVEHKINLPTKMRKMKGESVSEPFIKFRTSAIGIHPLTGKLFLLSASDHMLFIFGAGKLEHIELLKPELFNKAEGISFFGNGDVLITNEGQDKKPTVLRFNAKKAPE